MMVDRENVAKEALVSADDLRALLDYDPETGAIIRRPLGEEHFASTPPHRRAASTGAWNSRWAGKQAGSVTNGYLIVNVKPRPDGKNFRFPAHRIAWCIAHGHWPAGEIDHINGDRTDNRIANLRDVTRTENAANLRMTRRNTSGASGVALCRQTGRWIARCCKDGRNYWLGRFAAKDEAEAAVRSKRRELGFSPRHGEPAQAMEG